MPHGFAVGDRVRFHPISRMIDMARGPYMGGDAGDDAFCPERDGLPVAYRGSSIYKVCCNNKIVLLH